MVRASPPAATRVAMHATSKAGLELLLQRLSTDEPVLGLYDVPDLEPFAPLARPAADRTPTTLAERSFLFRPFLDDLQKARRQRHGADRGVERSE